MARKGAERSWIEGTADAVLSHVDAGRRDRGTIVVASGISPSGPIHLGNLREFMTPALVAEELALRGHDVDYLHSWDDFDRIRKFPPQYADRLGDEQIGRPYCDVPDPLGEYPSYGDRHIAEFEESMVRIGIRPRYIRQSIAYRSGAYLEPTRLAMRERHRIFDVLAEFQTESRQTVSREERRSSYWPARVYCGSCGRDTTAIESWDEPTDVVSYRCASCGNADAKPLPELDAKLVWKVDWPMRWAHERVDFEPGGPDHSSPGSGYDVGRRIVDLFGWRAPVYVAYSWVGAGGRSKLSGSSGDMVLPQHALDILEPPMLRWLYARRKPEQSFSIEFGREILRLYDEWDAFLDRVDKGQASPAQQHVLRMSTHARNERLAQSERRLPFRMLSSVADITEGNREQIQRIVEAREDEIEPRLTCAIEWALRYQPEDERTIVRSEPAPVELSAEEREQVRILLEKLEDDWSLEGLTTLVYGVPKLAAGMPIETPPTDELKAAQRRFFTVLYELLVGSDTGPRLPTLLLSIGAERVRKLLSPVVS